MNVVMVSRKVTLSLLQIITEVQREKIVIRKSVAGR
jgi:hypothetical protein